MRNVSTLSIAVLLLSGCTVAGGATAFRGDIVARDAAPVSRCDNYARQTYYNALEDYSDDRGSLSSRLMTRQTAERAADRAYERCRQGRLN